MSSGKMYSLRGLRGEPWTKRNGPIPVRPGQFAQELPAALVVVAIGGRFELLSRPENGALGADVEPVGVEHRPLVVVAQQGHLAGLHHPIDALARIGTVADDVAQAKNLGDPLRLDVVEHHFQGFEVPMNITDQSAAHRRETSDRKWPGIAQACQTLNPTSDLDHPGSELSNLILAPLIRIGRSRPDGQVHDVMVSISNRAIVH